MSGAAALPRSARLQRREHYTEALAAGAAWTRRYFSVYVRPNGQSAARVGVITSARVAPRAVDRNLVKRMVREAFRMTRRRLPAVDIVVQLRRSPQGGSAAAARAEVVRALEELAAQQRRD